MSAAVRVAGSMMRPIGPRKQPAARGAAVGRRMQGQRQDLGEWIRMLRTPPSRPRVTLVAYVWRRDIPRGDARAPMLFVLSKLCLPAIAQSRPLPLQLSGLVSAREQGQIGTHRCR